jgi:uncharacterized protein
MYKQSFYNIIKKNLEGRVVLFNTRTGGVVVPSSAENNAFIKILNNPDMFSDHDPLKMELIKHQFLIENNFNEFGVIRKSHEESINKLSSSIRCAIIPTKLCNFGCSYCCLQEPKNTIMDETVYSKIYKYITQKIITAKEQFKNEAIQLHIMWFGGEPTLESGKILEFMGKLMFLAEVYNIQISSTMVTNGYLLDYKLFERFVSKKITTFQVTLDGNKNTHDQNRCLKTNKQATFDKIYNNLLEIQKKVPPDMNYKIAIRTNVTKFNIGEMELFRRQIEEDFKDKRISHYFSCVCKYKNKDEVIDGYLYGNHDGLRQLYFLNIENAIQCFKDHSISEMYNGLPRPRDSHCMVHNDTYAILPNGDVVACHAVDTDDSIGKLEADGRISFNDVFQSWKMSVFQDKDVFNNCYKCNLLPICMGGCKYSLLCNSSPRCEIIEDNVLGLLGLYLEEYLNKASSCPDTSLATIVMGAKIR